MKERKSVDASSETDARCDKKKPEEEVKKLASKINASSSSADPTEESSSGKGSIDERAGTFPYTILGHEAINGKKRKHSQPEEGRVSSQYFDNIFAGLGAKEIEYTETLKAFEEKRSRMNPTGSR